MFNHSNLKPNLNSRKKSKRLGRGNGSGKGSFSGKGCKGQNARTGAKFNPMFEGGQTPLVRRMPKKRGFTAIDSIKYFVINVSLLQKLAEKGIIEINKESLISAGILKKKDSYIKLLGDGELKSKINLTVNAASKQGIEKVEKAGGKIEIIQIKVTKLVKIPYSERQDKLIKKPKVKIEPKETKVKKEAIKDEEKVELKAEKTPKAKVVKKVEKKVEKKSEKKTTPKKKAVK